MVDTVHEVEDASQQSLLFFCWVSIGIHYWTPRVSSFVNLGKQVKPPCFWLIYSQIDGIFHFCCHHSALIFTNSTSNLLCKLKSVVMI